MERRWSVIAPNTKCSCLTSLHSGCILSRVFIYSCSWAVSQWAWWATLCSLVWSGFWCSVLAVWYLLFVRAFISWISSQVLPSTVWHPAVMGIFTIGLAMVPSYHKRTAELQQDLRQQCTRLSGKTSRPSGLFFHDGCWRSHAHSWGWGQAWHLPSVLLHPGFHGWSRWHVFQKGPVKRIIRDQ